MNGYGFGGMEMHSQLSIATAFVLHLRGELLLDGLFKYDMI